MGLGELLVGALELGQRALELLVAARQVPVGRPELLVELAPLQGGGDLEQEVVQVPGLLHVLVDPHLVDGPDRALLVGVPGEQDQDRLGVPRPHPAQEGQPVHPGHLEIRDEVGRLLLHGEQGLLPRRVGPDLVAGLQPECRPQAGQDQGIVVHHVHPVGHAEGVSLLGSSVQAHTRMSIWLDNIFRNMLKLHVGHPGPDLATSPGMPNTTNRRAGKNRKHKEEVRFSAREREYAFSVAMKYVKDEDEAADVAQDALLNAYRHRASFRGDSRYTTWLYRVAATTALMHLRKKRRVTRDGAVRSIDEYTDHEGGYGLADLPAPGPTPEDHCAAREAVDVALDRLDDMGDKYGDVFVMRFRDGFSDAEIAKRLQLNVATVKTRAYRARAAVRTHLEQADAA